MEESNLPVGWVLNRLGDFVRYQKGKKPKSITNNRTISHSIPYVNIKAFELGIIDEYTNGDGCIICNQDDFLMVWDGSRSGYVGRAIEGALGSTLVKIQFPGVNLDYAYYFLQSKYIQINSNAKGTGIPHVDPNLLWNYIFPLPPLAEQYRIVAKLEELFSELDKGIESLKTAQQQLKVYRQAVLKYAFEGKLTNPNVKEGELPEGWVVKKSSEIIDFINSGSTPSSEYLSDNVGDIPFLKVYNLNFDGTLNHTKNPVFVTKDIHYGKSKRSICLPNDVLINIVGPPLGKVSVLPKLYPEWNINQAIVAFRPNEKIIPKYLAYQLQNQVLIRWLENTSQATAGQWNIKVSTCREVPLVIPKTIEEQELIVQEIESRLSVCDKIEEGIEQGLKQAEALRQSILKKAFEGKLVAQNPSDEPANVLLERIKKERATTQTAPKTRTKKVKA